MHVHLSIFHFVAIAYHTPKTVYSHKPVRHELTRDMCQLRLSMVW